MRPRAPASRRTRSSRRAAAAAHPPRRTIRSTAAAGGAPIAPASSASELSEAALVRELLFVMQNIDGTHLKWDAKHDGFSLLPSGAKVPAGARQLAGRLAELGWLFRQISNYVKAAGTGGICTPPLRGACGLRGRAACGAWRWRRRRAPRTTPRCARTAASASRRRV